MQDRIERLDAIGFTWAVRTRRFVARDWDAMVAQLEAFHRDHGHCNVPNAWPRNRELAAWLHGVRCNKRSGRLDADRVRQLDALGVVWEPQQTRWENMFAALVEYRQRHGDCNVPCGWPENPALAKWVKGVRASQKRGDLDFERIRRLDAIGFGWERRGELAGKRCTPSWPATGMSMVTVGSPPLSEDYRSLGNWVHTQRTLRKQGRLDQERIAQLDAIGFTWDLRREQWDAMFAALEDYRRANGHCDVPATGRTIASWATGSWCSGRPTRRAGLTASRSSGCGQSASASASSAIGSWWPAPRSLARLLSPSGGVLLSSVTAFSPSLQELGPRRHAYCACRQAV